MVQIGRINKLTVIRIREYGAHLDGGESGDVILPGKSVPEKCQTGDEVEVFVYVDKEERLRATTQKPYATAGQFARLKVVANVVAGSYLDWGLRKDLFVPKSEQLVKMEEGRSYEVFISLEEETSRIFASSKLDKFLSQQPPVYSEGEEVDLIIYEQTDLYTVKYVGGETVKVKGNPKPHRIHEDWVDWTTEKPLVTGRLAVRVYAPSFLSDFEKTFLEEKKGRRLKGRVGAIVAAIEDACAERFEIDFGGFEVIPIGVTVTLGKCSRCGIIVCGVRESVV